MVSMEDRAAGETIGRLTNFVLETPDPHGLAAFYGALLGWPTRTVRDDWVTIGPDAGGAGIAFQWARDFVAPEWPATPGHPTMQAHIDIEVHDLDLAAAAGVRLGAQVAAFQPNDDVKVMLDPSGHPFCFWVAL